MKKLYVGMLIASTFLIASCGGNSSGSGGGSTPTNNTNYSLSIDNTGTIPVIGNSGTNTVVYIHNNTNQTITNIINDDSVSTSSKSHTKSALINTQSDIQVLCSSIPAGQSCPIAITTPSLSNIDDQGSMIVKLNYTYGNKPYSVSNVINYKKIANNIANGAVIASGVILNSFGNQTAYGTVYVYGSGLGKVYDVTTLALNNSGFKVIQGNIQGQQIQSGFVQAIEVSAPASIINQSIAKIMNGATAILTVQSYDNADSSLTYTSAVSLGTIPSVNGAILTAGAISPVDTSVVNPTGSLILVNGGNESATLGAIQFPNDITAGTPSGSECGASLAPANSCVISFNVAQGSNGNGDITVPYSSVNGGSQSITQNASWYNGIGAPLVSISFSNNPVVFNQTQSESTIVTITNIGGYNLESVATTAFVTSGNAVPSVITPLSCKDASNVNSGTTLYVGGSCTYAVSITDSTAEAGTINTGITAKYNNAAQTYVRTGLIIYQSNSYQPQLVASPNSVALLVEGNNRESSIAVVKITNTGPALATITSPPSLAGSAPAYLTIAGTTCGATLGASESCTVSLKLGPTTSNTEVDGATAINLTYNGAAISNTTLTSQVDYTVLPNQIMITASYSAIESLSGDGTSGSPYIFNGANTNNKFVVINITNSGNKSVTLSGINNITSGIAWNIDSSNSTCYSNPSSQVPNKVLAVNESCTISYSNVLIENTKATNIGSSYTSNITIPALVFQDTITGHQFEITPPINSGTMIYATNTQATIANNIMIINDSKFTITNTLANANGYTAISVLSRFESYILNVASNSSGCSIAQNAGIVNQTCNLTQTLGTAIESVTYTFDKTGYAGATLNVLYSIANSNNQVVSISPLYDNLTVPTASFAYLSENNGGTLRRCGIRYDGTFMNCMTPDIGTNTSFINGLTLSNDKHYLYILSASDPFALAERINQCTITESGALIDCAYITGIDFVTKVPQQMAFNEAGDIAFISYFGYSSTASGVFTCDADIVTGAISGCVEGSAFILSTTITPKYMSVNAQGSVIYATDSDNNIVFQCSTINVSGLPILNGCTAPNFTIGVSGGFTSPAGMTLNKAASLAYIFNTSSSSLVACRVDPVTSDFTGECFNTAATLINGAMNSALNSNGKLIYITNTDSFNGVNGVVYCPVGSDGSVGACSDTGSNIAMPQYIVIK